MKNVSKGVLMTALLCGTVLQANNLVYAGEQLQEFNLDTMVVTATRTMKDLQEVPSSVSVVTAEELENRNVTSVQEALQNLPGVYMNQAAQSGIQLRGFGSTEILVLVDGQQMNTTYNGSVNFNMIPVESIERIEVLRGAASSIYGGHAVGGVINITTKEAKEIGTKVDTAVSYGSNSTWKKSLQVNSKIDDKWSFGLGYENRKSDGYEGYFRSAKGKAGNKSDYTANLPTLSDGSYIYGSRGDKDWEHEHYNGYVKYNFDDSKSIKYTYTKTDTEFAYGNANSYVKDKNGKPVYSGTVTTQNGDIITIKTGDFYGYKNVNERDTHALMYKDEENKFMASVNYVNNKKDGYTSAEVPKDYNGLDWNGIGGYSSHPGKIYDINMEKAWENIGNHTIVLGASFKQEEMTQDRYELSNWQNIDSVVNHYAQDKGKVKNLAIFLQDEYKISEPLTLYAGARLDHYKKCEGSFWNTEDKFDENSPSETYNEISPKVALDYKADEDTNYYISYGHSFNPPEMYKIYRYSEYSKYWYLPNPELDPETSDTFEIGMKKKLSDKTNLGLTIYHVKTKDKVYADYVPGEEYKGKKVKKYMNFDSEERDGVELEVKHDFSDKYSAYLNYAWQKGTIEDGGKDVDNYNIPRHLLHAGIEYNIDKLNALLDCQYVSERMSPDEASGEYGAEDAFFIVNLGVNYEIAKNTKLQLAVNNLFDRDFYCDEATAGRTYTVGMRYSF